MLIIWEVGWDVISRAITKLKRIVEGFPEEREFTSEEYIFLYSTVFQMCSQQDPYYYSPQLYDKYRETFEEYIHSTVLPSIRGKHGEVLLRELVSRWENYKKLVARMSHFFQILDREFALRKKLPLLKNVGMSRFFVLVYEEVKAEVQSAVIALMSSSFKSNSLSDQEREGNRVALALLEKVQNTIIEIERDISLAEY